MRVEWTRLEDALVCLSYLDHGEKVTDELRAAIPRHSEGSISGRLGNVRSVATNGASGLANVAAQTREVWAIVQKVHEQ